VTQAQLAARTYFRRLSAYSATRRQPALAFASQSANESSLNSGRASLLLGFTRGLAASERSEIPAVIGSLLRSVVSHPCSQTAELHAATYRSRRLHAFISGHHRRRHCLRLRARCSCQSYNGRTIRTTAALPVSTCLRPNDMVGAVERTLTTCVPRSPDQRQDSPRTKRDVTCRLQIALDLIRPLIPVACRTSPRPGTHSNRHALSSRP